MRVKRRRIHGRIPAQRGTGVVNAVVDYMSVVKKDEDPDPQEDATSLAPGVWVTEAAGFACVPPRAQSDLRNAADESPDEQADDDKECGTTLSREEVEPRIERYRER